jgi:hypothetical protein
MALKDKAGPSEASKVAKAPVPARVVVEAKAAYTDDEQAAYFGANLTADQDNVKPYADIHDWYRRTGGKVGA